MGECPTILDVCRRACPKPENRQEFPNRFDLPCVEARLASKESQHGTPTFEDHFGHPHPPLNLWFGGGGVVSFPSTLHKNQGFKSTKTTNTDHQLRGVPDGIHGLWVKQRNTRNPLLSREPIVSLSIKLWFPPGVRSKMAEIARNTTNKWDRVCICLQLAGCWRLSSAILNMMDIIIGPNPNPVAQCLVQRSTWNTGMGQAINCGPF